MEPTLSKDGQEAIELFPRAAEEFCRFIDGCASVEPSQLVSKLCVHLAKLCEVAVRLPWVNPVMDDGPDFTRESITEHSHQCVALATKLQKQLGALDEYWEVLDTTRKEEPIHCSVAMDLADIYMDLQDALRLRASGMPALDIYFQWRLDFHSHWSHHAGTALRVLLTLSGRV